MNEIEKELKGYMSGAERLSGFDSYDSAEGDMSYFDDDEMSNFDDDQMSYASGGAGGGLPVSDPYIIQYVNTTTNDVTATIFGFNDTQNTPNFGNPAAVVITNSQGGTYGRLWAQSNNKPFKIGKIRFESATAAQLQQTYSIIQVDASGKTYTVPLNLSVQLDAYQFQATIRDVVRTISVDGNTSITFTLKASATLVISMYPIVILSGKAVLNGGKNVNNARAPRLSGKNVAPVIIQTTQPVNSVSKG